MKLFCYHVFNRSQIVLVFSNSVCTSCMLLCKSSQKTHRSLIPNVKKNKTTCTPTMIELAPTWTPACSFPLSATKPSLPMSLFRMPLMAGRIPQLQHPNLPSPWRRTLQAPSSTHGWRRSDAPPSAGHAPNLPPLPASLRASAPITHRKTFNFYWIRDRDIL